jgi:hypothetical protein
VLEGKAFLLVEIRRERSKGLLGALGVVMKMQVVSKGSQGCIFYENWEGGLWVMREVFGEGLRHSHNIGGNVAE